MSLFLRVLVAVWLLGVGAAQAGLPIQNEIITVPNNTALRALSAKSLTQTAIVARAGFTTSGDGGALQYKPSSSACSLNAGAGDNGSQVTAVDGGCFIAMFGAAGADVRVWGAVADNTTDSTTAITNAIKWSAAQGGTVLLPAGTIYMAGSASATLSAQSSITVIGAGSKFSTIRAAAGISPFSLTLPDQNSSFHIRGFSCVASGTATATCLTITQAQSSVPNPVGPMSDLTDLDILGSTGYENVNGFTTDVKLVNVSNVGVWGGTYAGQGSASSQTSNTVVGTGFDISGSSTDLAVVFNFHGVSFINLVDGIKIGPYTQGVVVDTGSNCVVAMHCVNIPATSTPQTEQLTVANSQFNCFMSGCSAVFVNIPTPGVFFNSNLCLVYPSTTCVNLPVSQGSVVNDNQITGIGTAVGTGINVGSTFAAGPTTIGPGNVLTNLASAITLGATADWVSVQSPVFNQNTSNLSNANTVAAHDSIKGAPLINQGISVTGAANNGSGFVRLTVATTAQFVTGEQALVTGVGGVGLVSAGVLTPVTIVDATHMDLLFITFSGAYTSGGTIWAVP